MIKNIQKNLGVWMRAVTLAFVAIAILLSASLAPQEMDHGDQPVQVVVASVADAGLGADYNKAAAPTTNCHIGHSCVFVVLPSKEMAASHVDGARAFPQPAHYLPSGSGYPPFHPPRTLS